MIDNNAENIKNKPPKVPKNSKLSIKDSIIINMDKLNLNKSRSRQKTNLNKKSNTIQISPKKIKETSIISSQLDLNKNSLKRKSSHHADFSNYVKFKNTINRIDAIGSIKSLQSSIRENDSTASLVKNSFRDASIGSEQPEIEFISEHTNPDLKRFNKIRFSKSGFNSTQNLRKSEIKLTKALVSFKDTLLHSKSSKLSLLDKKHKASSPLEEKQVDNKYSRNLDSLAQNLVSKMKNVSESINAEIKFDPQRSNDNERAKKIMMKNSSKFNKLKIEPNKENIDKVAVHGVVNKSKVKSTKNLKDKNKIKHMQLVQNLNTKPLGDAKTNVPKVKIKRRQQDPVQSPHNVIKAKIEIPQIAINITDDTD